MPKGVRPRRTARNAETMAYAVVTLAAVAVTILAGCQKVEPPAVAGKAASSASLTSSSSSVSSQPTSEASTSSPPPPTSTRPPSQPSTRPPTQPSTRPPAPLAKAKRIYWENLKPGKCVRNPSNASVLYITVVDCSATHDAEVTLRVAPDGNEEVAG